VRNEQVLSVRGDAELIARAGHLFESARAEFVCAVRDLGTWSHPSVRTAIMRRVRAGAAPGLTPRKLVGAAALADEGARAHLRRVTACGVRVRISAAPLPYEAILIDRRVMILAGRATPAGREYTVTTSPALVDGVHTLIGAVWDHAADLGADEGDADGGGVHGDPGGDPGIRGGPGAVRLPGTAAPHLDPGSRAVLRALAAGLTDAAAARRLGVSLRTYRRRVAELMTTLDADSRFQAGLRAGELGLPR
jgi:hypothetical protein